MPDPRQPDFARIAARLCEVTQQLAELVAEMVAAQQPAEPGFVPTPFQRGILDALNGKALRTDPLGKKVGNRRKLFNDPGGLPELQEEGLVGHHPRIGFYSTANPPPELAGEREG
jgi:hypothetical protein